MSSHRSVVVSIATAALLAGVAARAGAQCLITGPTRVCPGDSVQLCSASNGAAQWTLPDGSTSTTHCITASQPGTYKLRSFDNINNLWFVCQSTLEQTPADSCGPPPTATDSTNCPRPASFWERQFTRTRSAAYDRATLTALGTCADTRAAAFTWTDAYAGLRSALQPRDRDAWRAGAVRQFAAVLANLCARDAQLVAGGVRIGLDPDAAFTSVHGGGTVGGWAQATDAELVQLAGSRPRDRAAREAYHRIVCEGWAMLHGVRLTRVCRAPATLAAASIAIAMPEAVVDAEDLSLDATLASIDASAQLAETPAPSPNPFRDATHLAFAVPDGGGDADVAVFDVSGRRVATLVRGPVAAGALALTWDGRDDAGTRVRSGMYFVHARVAGTEWTRSVLRVQ